MYLKNFKMTNKGPKILYLDQNFWIFFARVHYGKEFNILLSRILDKLFDAVSNDKLIIPINLTNIMEVQKIQDLERREKLAKFMISLSKGYSFIPHPYIEYKEIENLVLKRIGRPLHNIREIAIGKGLLYMISDGTPKFLREFKNSSLDLINETKNLLAKLILKSQSVKDATILDYFINPKRSYNPSSLIQKLEELRANEIKPKDKRLRKLKGMANYIINSIVSLLYQASINNNYDPYNFRLNEEEKIYQLLEDLPFFYTQHCLFRGLDMSSDHMITSNDIFDIRSFSFALPYSDYVIGERYTISLAKRNKIDSLYSTKLYVKSDISNFENEIDSL